jgi:hypothetical protein
VNPNFAGNIRDVFSCHVRRSYRRLRLEHSTEALRLSLEAPENAGFPARRRLPGVHPHHRRGRLQRPADRPHVRHRHPGAGLGAMRLRYLQAVTCNGGKNDGSVNVDLASGTNARFDDNSGLIKVQDQDRPRRRQEG